MNKSVTVSSLVCHRDIEVALICLRSLLDHGADPIQLRLHDDGSLTDEDRGRLDATLKHPIILPRAQTQEQVLDLLRHYPSVQRYRKAHVYGLKLDPMLLEQGPTYAYVDADVAFFRPFRNLFQFPDASVRALMMRDVQNSYSLRSWDFLRHPEWRIGRAMNAGLMLFDRSCFDLDFAEHYFRAIPPGRRTNFQEQTLWALLATRANGRLWDARQVQLLGDSIPYDAELVAGHFAAVHKADKPRVIREAATRMRRGGAAVTVRIDRDPPPRLSASALFVEELVNAPARVGRMMRRR